jgi:serine/threonine protein kinase
MKIKVLKEANTAQLQDVGHTMDISLSPVADPTIRSADFDDTGTNQEEPLKATKKPDPNIKMLEELGFEEVSKLGQGLMGVVYKVKNKKNIIHAIKIVKTGKIEVPIPGSNPPRIIRWSGEKEIRAYKALEKSKNPTPAMKKHFPEVLFVKENNRVYLIGMELLTDKGSRSFKLQDLFQGPEGGLHPTDDMRVRGGWKDLRRRMFTYLSKEESRNKILDDLLENVPDDLKDKIKNEMATAGNYVGSRENPQLEKKILEMVPKYVMKDAKNVFIAKQAGQAFDWNPNDEDWLKDKWRAMPGVAYFILKVLKLLKEYRPGGDKKWISWDGQGEKPVADPDKTERWGTGYKILTKAGEVDKTHWWQNANGIAQGFAKFVLIGSPVPMHHKAPRGNRTAGAEDKVAAVFPEAKSIRQALKDFEHLTGLVARDMHDKNAMIRPESGEIVIVDLGMFRPESELKLREQKTNKKIIKCKIRRKK